MGLFHLTKQNSQKIQDVDAQETQLTSPIIPFVVEEKIQPLEIVVSQKEEKKEKDDFGDFFSINIYNIFQYNPALTGKKEGAAGKGIEIYTLKLNGLELSTFHQVDVIRYENGHYDLVFSSSVTEIKDDLKAFIHFCVDNLGPDFMQKEGFTAKDAQDIGLGVFSRVWCENIRIENVYYTLSMTLYDITPALT
jgi:hypothetical protein